MIVGVLLALGSAALFGTSDYFGATASRRMRVLPTTTLTYAFAVLVFVVLALFSGGVWSPAAGLWGAVAGVFSVVGFLAFYGAMASGPMSLMSPLIAVLESAVPVAVAVILGEYLASWSWFAVGMAVIACLLISVQVNGAGARLSLRPLLLALVSGISLGLSLVALDLAPHGAGLIPGVVELTLGLVLLSLFLVLPRVAPRSRSIAILLDAKDVTPERPSRRRAQLLAGGAGLLLGGGNALLILALHTTGLAIVSALVSLYPLATILLARTLLKERLSRTQVVGVTLAVAASALLALS